MTTVTGLPARRVPQDTFSVRLAIVRAEMGWNYDQAEAATGINSESWRMWEKAKRRCTDIEGVSRSIAAVTGYSYEWLMIGGALTPPDPERPERPRQGSNLRPTAYLSGSLPHLTAVPIAA